MFGGEARCGPQGWRGARSPPPWPPFPLPSATLLLSSLALEMADDSRAAGDNLAKTVDD